jgi:N-methylhydantoinase A
VLTIAVDIGGTFTDFCAVVQTNGRPRLVWTKEPSTRQDPVQAVLRGTQRLLGELGQPAAAVDRFLHGTTVATNAVLERKGARLGILMTDGFEDAIELGRQDRADMYRLDPEPETPAFLAPGRRRRGVVERIGADGAVVVPLDEDRLVATVDDLVRTQGVEALAVCYLFSFVNPAHEGRTREVIRARHPGVAVSLSHEVNPVFREYERACLTAFDAYLRPVMSRYLERLQGALRGIGVQGDVLTMQSRGGLASTGRAAERPITTLLSGPAAGVMGALHVARGAGFRDCITLDMGGTSADIALVTEGKPVTTTGGHIERYPLRMPMVDVNTIGAGGGSIAWVDGAGGLHVGPHSAGAEPGPACYGRGGTEPTVTDASLVLGYLDPAHFAGGVHLDVGAAWRAVERVAGPLGLSVPAAAAGIHRIVNARMADETRLVSVRRGHDPRRFTLVLFGGGGPVNGWAVAEELGIGRLLVPFAPGALSAFGLLVSRVECDDAITFKVAAEHADPEALESAYQRLEAAGRARLVRDGCRPTDVIGQRAADMRYVGQSYELEIPMPSRADGPAVRAAVAAFHDAHGRVYGHASPEAAVEFVNLRVVHACALPPVDETVDPIPTAAQASTATRRCYFPQGEGFVETAVFRREALPHGGTLVGPAVVHQPDTTIVIPPGYEGRVDGRGNLVLERGGPC